MIKLLKEIYGEDNCYPQYLLDRILFDCLLVLDDVKIDIASVNSYLGIMSHYNEYATKRRIMAKLPPKFYEYCYL